MRATWTVLAVSAWPLAAAAQSPRDDATATAFVGPSAGLEAGWTEHHFALEVEAYDVNDRLIYSNSDVYHSRGVGGGAFAGYDVSIATRVRLGLELAGSVGGSTNTADTPFGRYAQKPEFGVRGTVRLGYVLTPRLMGHALGGYGGNRYRIDDRIGIGTVNRWGSSFVVGGGAEYRIDRRLGVRAQVTHVDNQTWHVFVGVPIRF